MVVDLEQDLEPLLEAEEQPAQLVNQTLGELVKIKHTLVVVVAVLAQPDRMVTNLQDNVELAETELQHP
tara:strand:- start:53 stop:259 length:207 start_codon:yes stop_codon:yes gene_type:complete